MRATGRGTVEPWARGTRSAGTATLSDGKGLVGVIRPVNMATLQNGKELVRITRSVGTASLKDGKGLEAR